MRIFSMSLEGFGVDQIATALMEDGVLTPANYWASKGIRRPVNVGKVKKDPCCWAASSISKILCMREYCGDIVNFKTYSKSFKNKSRLKSKTEDMAIFTDVNEPIIPRSEWERVQMMKDNRRKKPSKAHRNIFSGLLHCADCGSTLHFQVKAENKNNTYYICPANNTKRRTCPSTHTVRADFLEQVVLNDIRRITRLASQDENALADTLRKNVEREGDITQTVLEERLGRLLARNDELDILYERIYEDKVLGTLPEERYLKLSAHYETEQVEAAAQIELLKEQIEANARKENSIESFLAVVRKYASIQKLTAGLLREFVDEIHVHQAIRRDGRYYQQIDIYYNCVGMVELPEVEREDVNPVKMETRKGVVLIYAPAPVPYPVQVSA
jgi:hypothetical protein